MMDRSVINEYLRCSKIVQNSKKKVNVEGALMSQSMFTGSVYRSQ